MCDFNLYMIILVCVLGGYLLRSISNRINPLGWLVALTMGGMISALIMLLPAAQKGSALAFVGGYVLIGVLILSALVLFGLSRLPGQLVPFNSPAVERTGRLLLPLLGVGLSVLLKNVLRLIVLLFGVTVKILFSLMVFILTLIDGSTRSQPYLLSPQIPA